MITYKKGLISIMREKMTKLYFENFNGEKEWIDLAFVSRVKVYQIDELYKIEFWGYHDTILGYYNISLETMNIISQKLNTFFNGKVIKFFKDDTIFKPKKVEQTIMKFSDLNGIFHQKSLDNFKRLLCETDSDGQKKLSVQFKNEEQLRIDKETYNFFKKCINY